jgi:hypothetical protein
MVEQHSHTDHNNIRELFTCFEIVQPQIFSQIHASGERERALRAKLTTFEERFLCFCCGFFFTLLLLLTTMFFGLNETRLVLSLSRLLALSRSRSLAAALFAAAAAREERKK